jgi:YD repeat-containing protein
MLTYHLFRFEQFFNRFFSIKPIKLKQKVKMLFVVFLPIFAFTNIQKMYAQVSSPEVPIGVPLSPNTQAVSKFSSIPVSLYTGTPQISIPLYQLNGRGISIPITLNYHASGIKVEEVSSFVGAGWALGAGGMIVRTIKDLDDLKDETNHKGFPNHLLTQPHTITQDYRQILDKNGAEVNDYAIRQYLFGTYDAEPDLFMVVLPTGGFKFLFDKNGYIITEEDSHIKFLQTPRGDLTKGWIVQTMDGTKYTFGNSVDGLVDKTTGIYKYGNYDTPFEYISAWYLKEIESVYGEKITFTYSNEYSFELPTLVKKKNKTSSPTVQGTYEVYQGNKASFKYRLLNSIQTFKGIYSTSINFTYGTDRLDYNGLHKLHKISVYEDFDSYGYGFLTKEIVFNYNTTLSNKLWLNSLREIYYEPIYYEWGGQPSISVNPYQFTYYNEGSLPKVPSTQAYQQDYWGYYNGATANTTPETFLAKKGLMPDKTILNFTYGGNREPNATYMVYGMLKRVTSPDGGFTEYEYEPHNFNNFSSVSLGGGVRVKKIRMSDGENTSKDHYKTFHYVHFWDETKKSGLLLTPTINAYHTGYVRMPDEIAVNSTYNGGIVTYSNVIVKHGLTGELGKTSYTFENKADAFGNLYLFSQNHFNLGYQQSIGFGSRNGKPLRQAEYYSGGSNSYLLVSTKTYKYETVTTGRLPIEISYLKGSLNSQYVPDPNNPDYIAPTQPQDCDYNGTPCPYIPSQDIYNGTYISLYDYCHLRRASINISYLRLVEEQDTTLAPTYNKPIVRVTKYAYNTKNQVISKEIVGGEPYGNTYQLIKYPYDFQSSINSGDALSILDEMKSKNIWIVPIEERVAVNTSANSRSGKIIEYGKFPSYKAGYSYYLPSKIYEYEKPISGSEVSEVPLLSSLNYKLRSSMQYDTYGNLIQNLEKDGLTSAYIYGYEAMFPIAEATNANVTDIAYTSFETVEKGNWTYSGTANNLNYTGKTGRYYYSPSTGAISKSGLSTTKQYIISFWARGVGSMTLTGGTVIGGGAISISSSASWQYVEKRVVGASSVSLAGSNVVIDEIRIHPVDASMKTYTYHRLYGKTSESDSNGRIMFYEYDYLGRLTVVKDEKGNILKYTDYHHSGAY